MENGKFFLEICADKRMQSHFLSVRDLLPETYFHCSPFQDRANAHMPSLRQGNSAVPIQLGPLRLLRAG